MFFSIFLLAAALSLDSLFVGFSYGMAGTRIPIKSKLIICIFSVIYSGIALFAGSMAANIFPPAVANITGVVILCIMGIWMLLQAIVKYLSEKAKNNPEKEKSLAEIFIKSLGITIRVIQNPESYDKDNSRDISPREALSLGFALSMDSMGAGLGAGMAGFFSFYAPVVIGVVQLVMLIAGGIAGEKVGGKLENKLIYLLPGIMLIALGIFRLI